MILACRQALVYAKHGCSYKNSSIHHSKRYMRSRQTELDMQPLRLMDKVSLRKPSERSPPIDMPLQYIREQIVEIDRYRTDDTLWSKNTILEAWKMFHQLVQTHTSNGDILRVQEMLDKDLTGLALCTSFAEVKYLLSMLAPSLREVIVAHSSFVHSEVEEFFIHLGQEIEVRGADWVIQLPPPSPEDLRFTLEKVGQFGSDGRGCIRHTPHRVSVWRGRLAEPLGLTIRVGRYVPNVAKALVPLAHRGSILILSKAGVGKTTLLRDLAASLSREISKPRVMIVDTSNEIGGDSPTPLPFLGRCRRIQVPRREEQQQVMTQVLHNHTPEYVIVDEIATGLEAEAAWSISQRGVHLIATCHGENLEGLLQNQSLNLLVGGAAQAFLSNEERRLRNKVKKTILERPHPSPFRYVVELNSRSTGHIYVDVNAAVDLILDDQDVKKNAAVGRSVPLHQPPSDEFLALVMSKDREIALKTSTIQRTTTATTTTTLDVEDLWSQQSDIGNDGYNAVGSRRRGFSAAKHDYHGGRSRKKTDDDLLDDLEKFL